MREARRAELAAVGLVGAVGDQIDAELALRRLDGGVNLAGRHVVAFGVELEVVDQRFHRALHRAALRRHDLAVDDWTPGRLVLAEQPVDALAHDLGRLAHLFHADQVAVVAVAVLADRNVEFHLGIAFVGLRLAQVPGRARAAHHDAGKTPGPGVVQRDHADIDVALLEDAVAGQQIVEVVDASSGTGRSTCRCPRPASAAGPGARRPDGNRPRACARRRRARRTPSAFRALRSPRAAASARRRPSPAS